MGTLYTTIKHPTSDKTFQAEAYKIHDKDGGKMIVDGVKLVKGKAVAIYECKTCLKKVEFKLEK